MELMELMELIEHIGGLIDNYGCDCIFFKSTDGADELAKKLVEMVREVEPIE